MTYTVHTIDTAPDAAREGLAAAKSAYGFIPNLLGVMSEAPALLTAYQTLGGIFDRTSLDQTQRQVVLLTTSYENNCEYCVAAHSAIAMHQKVPQEVIAALRSGDPIADAKLEALRKFTASVVTSRGWPTEQEMAAFLAAGHDNKQMLEVVLGVGMKTLSNYANHIAKTPLDKAFAPAAWSKAA